MIFCLFLFFSLFQHFYVQLCLYKHFQELKEAWNKEKNINDKIKAKNNQYRISEKKLFLVALILGGPGIYIGMYLFRHKTKHVKFIIGIPLIIIVNIFSIYYLILHVFVNL